MRMKEVPTSTSETLMKKVTCMKCRSSFSSTCEKPYDTQFLGLASTSVEHSVLLTAVVALLFCDVPTARQRLSAVAAGARGFKRHATTGTNVVWLISLRTLRKHAKPAISEKCCRSSSRAHVKGEQKWASKSVRENLLWNTLSW